MAPDIVDTIVFNDDYTIQIHHDYDCESPREYAESTIWSNARLNYMKPLHDYTATWIQELLEELWFWRVYSVSEQSSYVRFGSQPGLTVEEAAELVACDARHYMIVGMDAETAQKCGWIGDRPIETIEKFFDAEIDEWEQFCNGATYGYRIVDRNGDICDDCWGFIGWDTVLDEATAVARALPPVEPLFTVQLTAAELEHLAASTADVQMRQKLLNNNGKGNT